MSKQIGLGAFALLLITGVAAGTYMYSSGDGSCYKAAGSCPLTRPSVSSVTATVDSSGTQASCGSARNKTNFTAKPIDASAYTAIAGKSQSQRAGKVEVATLQASQSCATKEAESDKTALATVAQTSK